METANSEDGVGGSPPVSIRQDQQRDLNQAGGTKKDKLWEFKVRSEFIQGTTHKHRARGKKIVALSFEARCLFVYLSSFASKNSPQPFPAMKTIMFDTGWGISTIQKYRRELERAGYLRRDQPKREGRYSTNLYTLIHSPEPRAANQSIEKQSTEIQPADLQSAKSEPTKRYQGTGRGTSARYEDRHEVPEPGSSRSTGPSGAEAAAAAGDTPSASVGGCAPKPPSPASKAETFIQNFRAWSEKAGLSSSVVPRERQAVIAFFTDNQKFTVRELVAIMVNAWSMPSTKLQDSEHQVFWHCNIKSRRIKTFMEFLPAIQDELDWDGSEGRITKAYRKAEEIFLQRAAAESEHPENVA